MSGSPPTGSLRMDAIEPLAGAKAARPRAGGWARLHARLLEGLAGLAAVCISFVVVSVLYDVTRRTLGFGSAAWVTPLCEYALLYTVALAAPWLVRERGHIMVESMVDYFPPRLRRATEVFVCTLCIAVCVVLAYYFAASGWESFRWNEADMRAISIPRWLMYLPMPLMFVLSAIEFGRFIFGSRRLFSGHGSKAESL